MSDWSKELCEGAVLLTVNQRLSRHHMLQYQRWQLQAGQAWWETPSILPFRSWMSELHRQALNMGLSEVTLMPALLVQQAWRRIIDDDSSVYLLDPAGAARSALQSWELSCVWKCYNREDQYLSADQFAWQRWMTHYRSWLDERSAIDESLLPDELVQVLERASRAQLDALLPPALILDGFIQLPTQLDELVRCVQGYGTEVDIHTARPRAVVQDVSYSDDDTELLCIATQMRTELEHTPHQLLGLVVPDLQQRRDAVVRAFERVFYPTMSPLEIRDQLPAYEISLGQSLSDQPVIDAALSLLKLSAGSVSGNELSTVVLTPYCKAAGTEVRKREQFDRRLRDRRIRSLNASQFSFELYKDSRLKPALNTLIKRRSLKPANLAEWAARFNSWLDILGWPGKSIDSAEYQAVSAWLECLDDMQLLDDGTSVRVETAFAQLKSLASERIFQIETPAAPIQVMGRLESHGLRFDCLWVAGLDAEQWPPSGSPSAFLVIDEQKACKIPDSSAALRLALAEQEFRLWASQAPLMLASSVKLREGKELSRAALPHIQASEENMSLAQPVLARLAQTIDPVNPLQTLAQTLTIEAIGDFYGPEIAAGTKVGGGARLFENQALCPFRAFALHRLKIRPLEEVGLGLDPRQHGTLLHAALELFWKKVQTHDALLALGDEGLKDTLTDVVSTCMSDHAVPEELRALELTRLTHLLHEWLVQCEMPREPFKVIELEKKQRIEHGGIAMDVIIDRIDRVDGALVVVDYKTGVHNRVSTWADQRISNPQLPLYVLTDEEIEAASFAQVASNQCRFIGVASNEQTLPKVSTKVRGANHENTTDDPLDQWEDWRAHWQSSLDAIAQELRAGLATVTPMKTACTHCELKSLCRVNGELSVDTEPDSAQGTGNSVDSNVQSVL
ncbi:MAG: PD-(D/E)XK nuclease family protein [Granulosicoccus sp.]